MYAGVNESFNISIFLQTSFPQFFRCTEVILRHCLILITASIKILMVAMSHLSRIICPCHLGKFKLSICIAMLLNSYFCHNTRFSTSKSQRYFLIFAYIINLISARKNVPFPKKSGLFSIEFGGGGGGSTRFQRSRRRSKKLNVPSALFLLQSVSRSLFHLSL